MENSACCFFMTVLTRYGLPLFPKACQLAYRIVPFTYYACMYFAGMSVYLNTPMKSVRVVITNNGHRQSIPPIPQLEYADFNLQHISMRLKLSQDCHNLKLYCLRCRSEALKAQIIIFENSQTRSVSNFNAEDLFHTPATL